MDYQKSFRLIFLKLRLWAIQLDKSNESEKCCNIFNGYFGIWRTLCSMKINILVWHSHIFLNSIESNIDQFTLFVIF